MEWILFAILLIVCSLSLIEDRLQKYNVTIYISIAIVLILFAGLREVGFDRDSENYEYYFYNYDDPALELGVEYSFRLISRFIQFFSNEIHALFLFYALVGVSLKMFALKRLTSFWYLPIAIYIGNYYILHDLTQIRASIVSGLTLLAIPFIYQGKRKIATSILLIGCIFHYSTLALLPAVFFSSKDMTERDRWIWGALLPLGYIIHFLPVNFTTLVNIPYITDKIVVYEELRDKGIAGDEINIFNLVFLVKCILYIYVLYFYDTIKQFDKYLPIVVKFMGICVFAFPCFSKLPVLSFRISELYGIVEIVMFTYITYTILPKWLGKVVVNAAAIILFVINVFLLKILEPV